MVGTSDDEEEEVTDKPRLNSARRYRRPPPRPITEFERYVLYMFARGMTNERIADELARRGYSRLSEDGVKLVIDHLQDAFGVKGQGLALWTVDNILTEEQRATWAKGARNLLYRMLRTARIRMTPEFRARLQVLADPRYCDMSWQSYTAVIGAEGDAFGKKCRAMWRTIDGNRVRLAVTIYLALPPGETSRIIAEHAKLTPLEIRVARLVALGWRNARIIERLRVVGYKRAGRRTVSRALASLRKKLGVERGGVVVYAIDHLLSAEERDTWRVNAEKYRKQLLATNTLTPLCIKRIRMLLQPENRDKSLEELAAMEGVSRPAFQHSLARVWHHFGEDGTREWLIAVFYLAPPPQR